jgi:hypothetical protein
MEPTRRCFAAASTAGEGVVLGAFFIVLIQNGMDLMQIGSYMQMVLLGVLLILAVIVDQIRYRLLIGRIDRSLCRQRLQSDAKRLSRPPLSACRRGLCLWRPVLKPVGCEAARGFSNLLVV